MAEPLFLTDLVLALLLPLAGAQLGRQAGRLGTDRLPAKRWPLYALLIVVVARVAVTVLLVSDGGWVLVAQRVLLGLPVVVIPLAWALAVADRGAGAATAWHTTAMGALASSFLLFVPPGPQDTGYAALGCLVVLGASAVASRLHRARRAGAGRLARLPWQTAVAISGAVAVMAGLYITSTGGDSTHASAVDWGGGARTGEAHTYAHGAHRTAADTSTSRSVTTLTGPRNVTPDVSFDLTAAHSTVRLASGKKIDALLYNGTSPGPELRVRRGDVVEVTLHNTDVAEGVTLHWHGVDVPNAEDGVPGVTQDAVLPGGTHVYRFVPDRSGTFWYHTHRGSENTVERGLFGSLIVEEPSSGKAPAPAGGAPGGRNGTYEQTLFTHGRPGSGLAFGTEDQARRTAVRPGTSVHLRLINSSKEPQRVLIKGTTYRVTALDGNPVNRPGILRAGTDLLLAAGGRFDVSFTMPAGTVTVRPSTAETPGEAALALSPDGRGAPAHIEDGNLFDRLAYGTPGSGGGAVPSEFQRDFDLVLDNGFGFADGRFTYANTINGRLAPAVPTLMVAKGDQVRMRITNRGLVDHPTHLHGHRIRVLSRNGEAATGSPWYTDTLNVAPGESYEVAFTADNPGIWMDHCHNFAHSAEGMIMHLAYVNVTSPYHGASH